MNLLRIWVVLHKPKIITLSETWLNSNISDSELQITNYLLYRSDRCSSGGGVAIYVSSHLVTELIATSIEPLHF